MLQIDINAGYWLDLTSLWGEAACELTIKKDGDSEFVSGIGVQRIDAYRLRTLAKGLEAYADWLEAHARFGNDFGLEG